LVDERTGELHDYSHKKGVLSSHIVMPSSAGGWEPTRGELWNAAEAANRRGDAVTAREVEFSLPFELSQEARQALGLKLANYAAEKYNVGVDACFHAPTPRQDPRNFHVHMMMTAKRVQDGRLTTKALELDPISCQRLNPVDGNGATHLREKLAEFGAEALYAAGLPLEAERFRYEHLDFDGRKAAALARGDIDYAVTCDREPTVHMGPDTAAMERKGMATELGDVNRTIHANNDNRAALKVEHATLEAKVIDLDTERERRAEDKAVKSAVKTFDPAKVIDAMTHKQSVFTRFELSRYLKDQLPDVQARVAFMDGILAHPDIVPLKETADAPISHYTSRQVLKQEGEIFANAGRLARNDRHGINAGRLADVLDRHGHLDGEQRRAVEHMTKAGGFAILSGIPGTGKSTTVAAVKDAYEASGYRVIGLSWQNSIIQRMKGDGFENAQTIMQALSDLDKGRDRWNAKTLLVVDEAAMVATNPLDPFFQKAAEAGAKVVFVQDRKQLGSIERGGVAAALEDLHAPARLTKIYRARHEDDKAAVTKMHEGDFRAALDLFDKRGSIHWQQTPEASRAALVDKWADLTASDPKKQPLVIAYTNAEVLDLNRDLRAIRRERGQLGDDKVLAVKDGETAFATGDRVQFTGSDRDRDRRAAGLYTGAFGTITDIRENRVTVAVDGGKDTAGREVSFVVGENARQGQFNAMRHGYASTTHKNQGSTTDESLVLHSDHWRAAISLVAGSRHREQMHLFAAEKPAAWIMAEGGLAALTEKQRTSAEASYSAWAEAKPNLAARFDLPAYVAYVQDHWKGEKDLPQLDRLASQMGRVDETRAASQFVQAEKPRPADERPLPPIYSRYDELRKLSEAVQARKAGSTPPPANDRPPTPQQPLTAEERLAAREAAYRAERGDTQPRQTQEGPEVSRERDPDAAFIRQRPPDRGRSR
jgi:Ti-type conjugative transfer relaxase TraA